MKPKINILPYPDLLIWSENKISIAGTLRHFCRAVDPQHQFIKARIFVLYLTVWEEFERERPYRILSFAPKLSSREKGKCWKFPRQDSPHSKLELFALCCDFDTLDALIM